MDKLFLVKNTTEKTSKHELQNFHSYACCNINFKKASGGSFKQIWTILDKFGNNFRGFHVLCTHSKPVKKWGKKCSIGRRFICTEVTSYKIHILINNKDIGDCLCTFLFLYYQQIWKTSYESGLHSLIQDRVVPAH